MVTDRNAAEPNSQKVKFLSIFQETRPYSREASPWNHPLTHPWAIRASCSWGGRVHTEKFGSSVIEIGANWIHGGCVANPVFNLANRRRKSLLLHDGKVSVNSVTGDLRMFFSGLDVRMWNWFCLISTSNMNKLWTFVSATRTKLLHILNFTYLDDLQY